MFVSLRKQLKEQGSQIQEIKNKVFNGFGIEIVNIKNGVNKLEAAGERRHVALKKEIRVIRNYFFTLLVTVVAGFVINGFIQNRPVVESIPSLQATQAEGLVQGCATPSEDEVWIAK